MHVAAIGPWYVFSAHHSYKQCLTRSFVAQSQSIHFCIPTAEDWTPAFPRLFGANPSWELLGQRVYQLSNNEFPVHNRQDNIWFLKWIGISADFALLRAFFSIDSPTAGAVYESLLIRAGHLRMGDLLSVLFELRHVVRINNPMSVNEADFFGIAIQIGSLSGNSLEVVKTCLSNELPLSTTTHNDRKDWARSSILIAASRCDIAILRVLVDAGYKIGSQSHGGAEMMCRIMSHIYNWDSQQEHTLTSYVDLLLRSGIIDGSPSPQCIDENRPKVISEAHAICSITWDELIMICPPTKRQALQITFMHWIADRGACISRAGVFTVAQDGVVGLRTYLEAHQEVDALLTRVTLEECLLFAAIVNDSKTVSVLLETGVDPYVGLLSNNLERYRKGNLPWSPSLVAAAAGHLEVLAVLLSHINPQYFLEFAPIHELVHHETRGRRIQFDMGRELGRLSNLRYFYMHIQPPSSRLAVEGSPDGHQHTLIGSGSFKTLEFIRSIAHFQGLDRKVDLEIIKAAVFCSCRPWLPEHKPRAHLPCEALLMRGLIDAHLDYKEEGMDLLHLSIRNHCSFTVVSLLSDKGLKVHSSPGGRNSNSMLHDALLSSSRDRSKIVQFLLEKGADCKFYGEGLTILEASLWNWRFSSDDDSEYLGIFERLLDAGAPVFCYPRKRLSKWRSLISLLLKLGASDGLILRVVDAGASLNAYGYGHSHLLQDVTPLQATLTHRREKLARELIRRGADVHAPASPKAGLTALQAACLNDLPIHFLEYIVVALGVKIDEPPAKVSGLTSLAGAVWGGSLNTVEFLLDHGADVNAMCSFSAVFSDDKNPLIRPLDLAVLSRSLDKVELLLKAGGRSRKNGLGGAIGIAANEGHFAILSILRSWDKRLGSKIMEEEALWQSRNPEQALMLSESANGLYKSDTDDDRDHDDSGEEAN